MSDTDTDSEKSFVEGNDVSENDLTDDEDFNRNVNVDGDEEEEESRFELNNPVFEDLPILSEFTDQELDLLPLSYIRGPLEQWNYIFDAVKSDFTSVANLAKVNERTLRNVTDVIRYSFMKGNSLTELQKNILRYETKRLT